MSRTPASCDATGTTEAGALAAWLADRWPDARTVTVEELEPCTGGYSAETLIVPVSIDRGRGPTTERWVVRRETPEEAIYPAQAPGLDVEVEIQFRTMEAISTTADVPLAPLVGYESDPGVLGAPFFVMGFVEGETPAIEPMYTRTGFFADATPEQRHAMLADGLRQLADLHRIDWRAAGLDWLVPEGTTPCTAAQLRIWEEHLHRELAGRSHPFLDGALAWLHTELPQDRASCVTWGDARPGNVIWRGFRAVCLTDFEGVAIGPPEIDLGWWLMFDRWCHETAGAPRLPGEPTREEQRDLYAAASGTEPSDVHYHEVFAALRYAAIVVRVMNRTVERGLLPADHDLWFQNQAVECLADLLDVEAPR